MAYADIEKKRRAKLAWRREWRKKNPDKARAEARRYRKAQHAKVLAYHRKWREDNQKRHIQYVREWQKRNPEKMRAMWAAQKARKIAATVPLTHEEQAEVIALYAKARALTELTGEPYHVDHIKPLAKGGLHHPSNLQVLRGVDNLRKGAKWQE